MTTTSTQRRASRVRNGRVNKRNRAEGVRAAGRGPGDVQVVASGRGAASVVAVVVRVVHYDAGCKRCVQSGIARLVGTHHGDGKCLKEQGQFPVTSS